MTTNDKRYISVTITYQSPRAATIYSHMRLIFLENTRTYIARYNSFPSICDGKDLFSILHYVHYSVVDVPAIRHDINCFTSPKLRM
jgi:hypothetical protein